MTLLPFDHAARNAGRAPARTVLIVLGSAAVVFLVMLMAAFVGTLGATLRGTGDPANAIVLGLGSEDFLEQSEIGFGVPVELAAGVETLARQPGSDAPLLSPEIHHAAIVRPADGTEGDGPDQSAATAAGAATAAAAPRTALIRGVTGAAFTVHRQVFIAEGSAPGPGQVLAGRLAATKLGLPPAALRPGARIVFEGRAWTVSGAFDAPGTAYESELWVPLDDLKLQTKRDTLTCVVARVAGDTPAARDEAMAELEAFAKTRLDLELAVVPEVRYYAALAAFYRPMQMMGWAMAALVTASGLFGGLNAMSAAIAARGREFACLETLGFRRPAIVVSLLQENLLQTGAGALIAAGLAALLLSGRAVKVTSGALALHVDGPVLAAGFAAALVLGVVGTLVPCLTMARKPLVAMLRG